jgi:hypothetical protein
MTRAFLAAAVSMSLVHGDDLHDTRGTSQGVVVVHEDEGTVAWDDAAHGLGGPETLPAVLTWLALGWKSGRPCPPIGRLWRGRATRC